MVGADLSRSFILDWLEALRLPPITQATDCAYLKHALYVEFERRLTPEEHARIGGLNLHIRHHRPLDSRHRYLIEFVASPDDER